MSKTEDRKHRAGGPGKPATPAVPRSRTSFSCASVAYSQLSWSLTSWPTAPPTRGAKASSSSENRNAPLSANSLLTASTQSAIRPGMLNAQSQVPEHVGNPGTVGTKSSQALRMSPAIVADMSDVIVATDAFATTSRWRLKYTCVLAKCT